jgi:hypothetical protein
MENGEMNKQGVGRLGKKESEPVDWSGKTELQKMVLSRYRSTKIFSMVLGVTPWYAHKLSMTNMITRSIQKNWAKAMGMRPSSLEKYISTSREIDAKYAEIMARNRMAAKSTVQVETPASSQPNLPVVPPIQEPDEYSECTVVARRYAKRIVHVHKLTPAQKKYLVDVYDSDEYDKMKPIVDPVIHKRFGVMVAVKCEDGEVRYGWSRCSKKDVFSREKGLMIAVGRAMSCKVKKIPSDMRDEYTRFKEHVREVRQ